MSDTPETDLAVRGSNGQWSFGLRDLCQSLERQRDAYAETLRAIVTGHYCGNAAAFIIAELPELDPLIREAAPGAGERHNAGTPMKDTAIPHKPVALPPVTGSLLPCPFCGGMGAMWDTWKGWIDHEPGCWALEVYRSYGNTTKHFGDTITAWNRRAEVPKQRRWPKSGRSNTPALPPKVGSGEGSTKQAL